MPSSIRVRRRLRRAAVALGAAVALAACGPGGAHAPETNGRLLAPSTAAANGGRSAIPRPAATQRPRAIASALAGLDPATQPLWPALERYLATRPGRVGVAVLDELGDRVYARGAHDRFICASIVKLQILATVLARAEHGDVSLTPDVRLAMTRMIEVSDNDAATALWNAAGGSAGVAAFERGISMRETSPDPGGAWGDTTTTPIDQLRLLQALAEPTRALTPADRTFAVSLMEHVDPSQAWGVSAGVPQGISIALKNGWLPVGQTWAVNSVGWISGAGRDYLIGVLTDDQPAYGTAIDTIASVSSFVWNALVPDVDGAPAPPS